MYMSIQEYLRTSFEDLDREYVDGEIVERAPHDQSQSKAHSNLCGLIWDASKTRPLHGYISLRSRVAPTHVRVTDFSIYAEPPKGQVPSEPALAVVEIVSDDRHSVLMQKLEEYENWGVPHVWLVDPERRKLYTYSDGSLTEVVELRIPEYEVRITPAEIFG